MLAKEAPIIGHFGLGFGLGEGLMARYQALEKLGSGGFGEVWKAARIEDGEVFAKKVLSEPEKLAPSDIERFQREVRLLRTLSHPRIVKVVDAHVTKPPYWFVMPLYRGSLRDLLPTIRDNVEQRSKVVEQLLEAMEYAHANGVIHRDLKPENILYQGNGEIVVSDFGLGRRLDAATTRKTYTGQMLGTPFYMAPEQEVDAKAADERCDVYSIGRIIYELYTGDPPSAQQDLSRLDSGMRHIVGKCTKGNPNERYQKVTEIRTDFELLAGGMASRRLQDDIKEILAKLVTLDVPSDTDIDQLHRALFPLSGNMDLLHDVFMTIPPAALEKYFRKYPDIVRDLIRRFSQNIIDSSWGFEYCDKIADTVGRLYAATTDTDIHVSLLVALLELGVSHNRWHVMDVFGALLGRLREPGEILAVRDAFRARTSALKEMKERLQGIPLPEPIRELVAALPN